jgi:rRNA-processing protein FCF1
MKIAIDNVEVDLEEEKIDLSRYTAPDEKYVHAVDNKVDMIITNDKRIADYFRDNGIAALIKV